MRRIERFNYVFIPLSILITTKYLAVFVICNITRNIKAEWPLVPLHHINALKLAGLLGLRSCN